MTVDEYRQRMIQAFHNADCDELIAICVLPTEKEFKHLEWLLKNHYKQEPCEDCISRQAVLETQAKYAEHMGATKFWQMRDEIRSLPSVTPQPKVGRWILVDDCERFIAKCSECGRTEDSRMIYKYPFCHCGARMKEVEE